jgi:hypothetical protein
MTDAIAFDEREPRLLELTKNVRRLSDAAIGVFLFVAQNLPRLLFSRRTPADMPQRGRGKPKFSIFTLPYAGSRLTSLHGTRSAAPQ